MKISDEIQGLQKEMKRQIELESNQETKDKQLLAQAKLEDDSEEKIQDLSLKQIEIKKEELNILKTSENVTLSQQI